jgi:hypothetical protein
MSHSNESAVKTLQIDVLSYYNMFRYFGSRATIVLPVKLPIILILNTIFVLL